MIFHTWSGPCKPKNCNDSNALRNQSITYNWMLTEPVKIWLVLQNWFLWRLKLWKNCLPRIFSVHLDYTLIPFVIYVNKRIFPFFVPWLTRPDQLYHFWAEGFWACGPGSNRIHVLCFSLTVYMAISRYSYQCMLFWRFLLSALYQGRCLLCILGCTYFSIYSVSCGGSLVLLLSDFMLFSQEKYIFFNEILIFLNKPPDFWKHLSFVLGEMYKQCFYRILVLPKFCGRTGFRNYQHH